MAAFKLPPIARSDDAFGPPRDALVESEIREMIYAPYNKTDKFGRCADWMSEDGAWGDASSRDARREERRERRERERESKRKDGASGGGGGAVGGVETVFNFVADAGEEESFSLVDNTSSSRGGGGGGRGGRGGGRGGGRWNQYGGPNRNRSNPDEAARDLGVGAERG